MAGADASRSTATIHRASAKRTRGDCLGRVVQCRGALMPVVSMRRGRVASCAARLSDVSGPRLGQPRLDKILIALAAIPISVTTEMIACSSMSIFAGRVSGSVSVGLNAKLVVNARNR